MGYSNCPLPKTLELKENEVSTNRHTIPIKLGKPHKVDAVSQTTSKKNATPINVNDAYRLKMAYRLAFRCRECVQTGEPSTYEPYGRFRGLKEWKEMAEKLHTHGIDDVAAYVWELFHSLRGQMVFPNGMTDSVYESESASGEKKVWEKRIFVPLRPGQLADPETVKSFFRDKDANAQRDLDALYRQAMYRKDEYLLRRGCFGRDSHRAVLELASGDDHRFSPLFRFSLAYGDIKEPTSCRIQRSRNQDLRERCDRVRDTAYIQYLGNPIAYREWPGLPADFEDAARAFFETLIAPPQEVTDRENGSR